MFSSAKIIIYLQSKTLDFYYLDGTHFSFPITPDLVENLEIKNLAKLEEDLTKFLTENKIKKGSALLVLSEDILFRKEIGDHNPQAIKEKLDIFLSEVPLPPDKISYKILEVKNLYSLVGVNKELYEALLPPLHKYGIKVTSVSPITASWIGNITKDTLKDLLADKKNLTRADFLKKSLTTIELQKNPLKTNSLNKFILIFILLFSLAAGAVLFYFFTKPEPNPPKKEEEISIVPTEKPKATPTVIQKPTEEKIDKEKVKLQVLNGNGGAGVASKAKGILAEAGFINIETGNAGVYDYENSLIQVKENNTVIFKTLVADLENDYTLEKTPETLPIDSPYDAIIIIGLK